VEPFKPFPQCVDCLMGLAHQAATQVAEGNADFVSEAEGLAREILSDAGRKGMTSPEAANCILREIERRSGVSDPYAGFKTREMARARRVFLKLGEHVGGDLRSRVSLAVLGNSLDFFTDPDEALSDIQDQIKRGVSFFHDDIGKLESFLSNGPPLVLYLTDNAGEVYFDEPLFEYVREQSERVILMVKGGPSLNDATRVELRQASLEKRFPEIADTGTDGVGIDWKYVSAEFMDLFNRADLILSKGMANFESIYPRDVPSPVFFLFKAKCQPIRDYLKAPAEVYWALWRDGHAKGGHQ